MAAEKIVQHNHLLALCAQPLDRHATDVPGTACHKDGHVSPFLGLMRNDAAHTRSKVCDYSRGGQDVRIRCARFLCVGFRRNIKRALRVVT